MSSVVGQHQVSTFSGPTAGGPRSAAVIKGNDDANRAGSNAHDADATIHVQDSDLASRPGAGTVGRKWLTTDIGGRWLYYDDGSAWQIMDFLKLTGGTLTGALTVSAGGAAITGNSSVTGTLTVSAALTVSAGGAAITGNSSVAGTLAVTGALTVTTAKTTLAASAAGYASINLPHGTAPSSPVNGDFWTTTAGLYGRINGSTVGPYVGGGGTASFTRLALTGTGPIIDGTGASLGSSPAIDLPSAADVVVGVKAGSGSMSSGGSNTILWASETADPKSLSSVGGGATTLVMNTGAYGGLWMAVASFANLYSPGSESARLTISSLEIGGTGVSAATVIPGATNGAGGASPYVLFCRIPNSTTVTFQITSSGGTGGISWAAVELFLIRLW